MVRNDDYAVQIFHYIKWDYKYLLKTQLENINSTTVSNMQRWITTRKEANICNTSSRIPPDQWANLLPLGVEWINVTLPPLLNSFTFNIA